MTFRNILIQQGAEAEDDHQQHCDLSSRFDGDETYRGINLQVKGQERCVSIGFLRY